MIVNNYLNYIGSKDRYLPQIIKLVEKGASLTGGSHFYDLFCGSAVVGLNAAKYFNNIVCVDICEEVIALHNWVKQATSSEYLIDLIDTIISNYSLSKDNKDGYLKLRDEYNKLISTFKSMQPALLYCLITHAYNYSLHTNKNRCFNVPFGKNKSSFNKSLRQKFINWKNELDTINNIEFVCSDFRYVIPPSESAVYFCDPPYSASISKHPYRVGNVKWGAEEDRALLEYLDKLNAGGHLFIFTNVTSNNGVSNTILNNWIDSNEYTVHPVSVDYKNCSYQRKNRGNTKEVIITNFK